MSNPVSVIIPCYNQGHYLERALRSCAEQTLPGVEVIVVNDGSTDNTKEICATLAGQYRFRYHEQTNGGLANARNAGINLANGKYLQFLDADDYLHPAKLEIQARHLDENLQYAYNYCDIVHVQDDFGVAINEATVGITRKILTGNIFGSLLIGGFFPPVCPLIRKETIAQFGGFTPKLDGHADYELWLRLAGHNQLCCYLDEKLAYYRVHEANMSKDSTHMNQTFVATIQKIAVEFPARFAEQFLQLILFHEGIFSANVALQMKEIELFAETQALHARLNQCNALQDEVKSLRDYTKCLEDDVAKKNAIIEKFRAKLKPSS